MQPDNLPISIKGHVLIEDDLGAVILDECNRVHPQNVARVIARALSNESNFWIHRVAFGNGGTEVNAAQQITYNTPNDGQAPDSNTWDSRLYNETYSEIIDEGNTVLNPNLGTDPGSAGPNAGQRPGGGAVPGADPTSVPHVSGPGVRSNELGLTSEVVITTVLNPGEPLGQLADDQGGNAVVTDTESDFMFDELGLYTSGSNASNSTGYQNVSVGDRVSTDDSTLVAATAYSFNIVVDGGSAQVISFTTPAGGGSGVGNEILYGDLVEAINTGDVAWGFTGTPAISGASMAITDYSGSFSSISGSQTFGHIRFESISSGVGSSIAVIDVSLFAALDAPTGATILTAVAGDDSGVQNLPTSPTLERERLLTHLVFSPILKSGNRTLTVTYTLTVSVARSI